MKYCNTCKETKEDGEFSRCKRNKCGLQSRCKVCNKTYYGDHQDQEKARSTKFYYGDHGGNLKRRAELRQRPEAKKKKREQDKKWINENREYYNERSKKDCHNRRARKKSVGGELKYQEIKDLYDKQGHCSYCGIESVKLTLDHIKPLNNGGANSVLNITLACGSCNYSKQDKDLLDWLGISEELKVKFRKQLKEDKSDKET